MICHHIFCRSSLFSNHRSFQLHMILLQMSLLDYPNPFLLSDVLHLINQNEHYIRNYLQLENLLHNLLDYFYIHDSSILGCTNMVLVHITHHRIDFLFKLLYIVLHRGINPLTMKLLLYYKDGNIIHIKRGTNFYLD